MDPSEDPLNLWKTSPIDDVAIKHWRIYTDARDETLARTHSAFAPWTIVRADDKRETHLSVIRDLLSRFEYAGKKRIRDLPDPNLTFLFDRAALERGLIAT